MERDAKLYELELPKLEGLRQASEWAVARAKAHSDAINSLEANFAEAEKLFTAAIKTTKDAQEARRWFEETQLILTSLGAKPFDLPGSRPEDLRTGIPAYLQFLVLQLQLQAGELSAGAFKLQMDAHEYWRSCAAKAIEHNSRVGIYRFQQQLLTLYGCAAAVAIIGGALLAVVGFLLWWRRLQRLQDLALAIGSPPPPQHAKDDAS